MKLAVSNIAWQADEQPAALAALRAGGATGVEVAPTMLWPGWDGATPASAATVRERLAAEGFAIPALQSLLFGRPELHLLGDPSSQQGLVDHIGRVAKLAGALGAGAMVFGSPRNRLRGEMSHAAAIDRAIPVLREIGDACAAAATTLGIEANPVEYGGDFLTRWTEVAELATRVDHPAIRLHLDTACTVMAGDDPVEVIRQVAPLMCHFHVSAPQLGPVQPGSAINHAGIAAALRASGYTGWVSIEMRRTDQPIAAIETALAFVRGCYG